MDESNVMKELREARDQISEEVKEMDIDRLKEFFRGNTKDFINEINKIRQNRKAM
jgi:uncharacterized coiled-coil DUF342 family protein